MEGQPVIKKILWKCRRGTKELDVILSRFVENSYDALSQEDKELFESLLEIEDPLLTEWLCLDVTPQDQGMVKIVQRILSADNP